MTVLMRVERVLIETMDVDPELVSAEAPIVSLGIDSMETSLLILELEEEFGISLPDDDMARFVTVQDIADYVERPRCGA